MWGETSDVNSFIADSLLGYDGAISMHLCGSNHSQSVSLSHLR